MRIARTVVLTAAVVAIAAITGCGLGTAGAGEKGKPIQTAEPASTYSYSPEPAPTAATPAPADFKLAVKILSKQCFGDIGCSITFRVVATYSGASLAPDASWRVLYVVTGDESGPITNSFTVTGDKVEYQSEESASTKSAAVQLTARVTEVLSE